MDSAVEASIRAERDSGRLGFRSSRFPEWCPSCGYFGLARAVESALCLANASPDRTVFVGAAGCVGLIPYYFDVYGLHSTPGDAVSVACGIKWANPSLSVVVFSGDGDAMGPGHAGWVAAARRDAPVAMVLCDNGLRAWGGGGPSPTAPLHPAACGRSWVERPHTSPDPVRDALAAGASFVAREAVTEPEALQRVLAEAFGHTGFAMVHVLLPCPAFGAADGWEKLRGSLAPLPAGRGGRSRGEAASLASETATYRGIFYEEKRDE